MSLIRSVTPIFDTVVMAATNTAFSARLSSFGKVCMNLTRSSTTSALAEGRQQGGDRELRARASAHQRDASTGAVLEGATPARKVRAGRHLGRRRSHRAQRLRAAP